MKLSLSTGTLYIYPLSTVLRWARQAGFDAVELVVNPEAIARGGAAVRRLVDAHGLALSAVHPTVLPLPGWRERNGGMDPTIRLARQAGAGLVVLHTPRSAGLDRGEGLAFRQRIERWQSELAGSGLRLAVENKAVRSQADRAYALTPLDRLRAFADRYDLGLVLDTTHAGTAGEDLLRARRTFGPRLANVHLSDIGGPRPLGSLFAVDKYVAQHGFPGLGDLALSALVADLARCAYAGPLTLEINPFAARAWWPPVVRRRLTRAVAWIKNAAAVEERGG